MPLASNLYDEMRRRTIDNPLWRREKSSEVIKECEVYLNRSDVTLAFKERTFVLYTPEELEILKKVSSSIDKSFEPIYRSMVKLGRNLLSHKFNH